MATAPATTPSSPARGPRGVVGEQALVIDDSNKLNPECILKSLVACVDDLKVRLNLLALCPYRRKRSTRIWSTSVSRLSADRPRYCPSISKKVSVSMISMSTPFALYSSAFLCFSDMPPLMVLHLL